MNNFITNVEKFLISANQQKVKLNDNDSVNSSLPDEEHIAYDQAMLRVVKEELNGIDDLVNAGLTVPIGGLGTTLTKYSVVSDLTDAQVSMDGMSTSTNDQLTFKSVAVPIPIFHKDWSIGIRHLSALSSRGIDTTQLEIATEIVARSIENALFNGIPDFDVEGHKVYGYTTYPNRGTLQLSGSGWKSDNADILGDTEKMLDLLHMKNRTGPFIMYVAPDITVKLESDYNNNKGVRTIKERIEAYSRVSLVKTSHMLASGNVLLVEMRKKSVDLAIAQDIVNIQWGDNPMETNFKVYGAIVPRIKSDYNGSCGIVHGF